MGCYLPSRISFRQIRSTVSTYEFVSRVRYVRAAALALYRRFASAREFRDQRGEQGVLRAKECSLYTCPSVHQSFSELQED